MAIQYIPKFSEYVGLSGDDKTSLTTNGSVIYYTDNKNRQILNNGVWSDYVLPIGTVDIRSYETLGLTAGTAAFLLANDDLVDGSIYRELDGAKRVYQILNGVWYEL